MACQIVTDFLKILNRNFTAEFMGDLVGCLFFGGMMCVCLVAFGVLLGFFGVFLFFSYEMLSR